MTLQPAVELKARGAEQRGGARLVPMRAVERLDDRLALEILQPDAVNRRARIRLCSGEVDRSVAREIAMWAAVTSVPSHVMSPRSMAFCNSRMLPGQGYCRSASHASWLSATSALPSFAESDWMNECARPKIRR